MSDEQRQAATIHITSYQRRLANSYYRRVNPRVFRPGDLLLTKVFKNTADPTAEKFQPNWEGPYVLTQAGEPGSYTIDKTDGTLVLRMWNAMHLRRYYPYKHIIIFYSYGFSYFSLYRVKIQKPRWCSKMTYPAQHRSLLAGQIQKPGWRSKMTCPAQHRSLIAGQIQKSRWRSKMTCLPQHRSLLASQIQKPGWRSKMTCPAQHRSLIDG